jgi:cell division inhibitor SulA
MVMNSNNLENIRKNVGEEAGEKAGEEASGKEASKEAKQETSAERARLFQHPDLWRAGQLPAAGNSGDQATTTPSGFPELDNYLPGDGWPQSGLSEVLLPTAGIGELQLLMPLLKQLSSQMRWIAWINPPFVPYAPALEAAGVDVSKILLIHPKNHKDALWSLERASRSGTCSLALAWLDEQQMRLKDTQRLQLAAKQGNTLTCLFRPAQAASQASMAELRLQLAVPDATSAGEPDQLKLSILKRRGGWPVPEMQLNLEVGRSRAEIREQLSLWRLSRSGTAVTIPGIPTVPEALQTHSSNVEQRVTH